MRRAMWSVGLVALLSSVSVASAQTPAPETGSPVKFPTLGYENSLKVAVMQAGQKLAQKARAIVPVMLLEASEPPQVRGVYLKDWGYNFDVQAPDIQQSVMVINMWQQARPNRGGPARPAATGDRPMATTAMVDPDPMEVFDANKVYTDFVKEALIDAMLDQSTPLPLKATDRLSIVASGIDHSNANPLVVESKLVLTISGSVLLDLRQGRLTRDQAKASIEEDRF